MTAIVFFDLDGTLLVQNVFAPQAKAICEAVASVGGPQAHAAVTGLDWVGKTDMQIMREGLSHTVPADDAAMRAVRAAYLDLFVDSCPSDLEGEVRPGFPDVLRELRDHLAVRVATITGNLRSVAAVKLRAAGLAGLLDMDASGFGDDAEVRYQIAVKTVARLPFGEAALLVGDTHRDIGAARAAGIPCVGYETPLHAGSLGDADWVVSDPDGVLDSVVAWLQTT